MTYLEQQFGEDAKNIGHDLMQKAENVYKKVVEHKGFSKEPLSFGDILQIACEELEIISRSEKATLVHNINAQIERSKINPAL